MSKLSVGITGHSGFIGSHLVDRLARDADISLVLLADSLFETPEQFKKLLKKCDAIVHLAGMNRGKEEEIYETNIKLAKTLVNSIEETGQKPQLIFSSSILSTTNTAFGRSKKESCQIFESWTKKNKTSAFLLTIPNVFGDRGKPFYNSVVATFCYQLAHGEQPKIIKDREIEFIYINDLIEIIYNILKKPPKTGVSNQRIKGTKKIAVSKLLTILEGFKEHFFGKRVIPALTEPFLVDLYNVFLSYFDYQALKYEPEIKADERGNLYEVLKLGQGGQVFLSTSKPGVIRGNHYHTRKIERFCVLQGSASIRLRRIGTNEIKEYKIDSAKKSFVDIPIFHTHQIENTGKNDLLTLFWCSELLDPQDPDTFYEEVNKS